MLSDRQLWSLALTANRSICPLVAGVPGGVIGVEGTGILVEFEGAPYLVTAKHVADKIHQLAVPAQIAASADRDHEQTWTFGPVAVRSSKNHDVAVVRLLSDELVRGLTVRRRFIPLSATPVDQGIEDGRYLIVGFPNATAPSVGNLIKATSAGIIAGFASPPNELALENDPIDPEVDLWLAHDPVGRTFGKLPDQKTMPPLNGVSGGAVWKIVDSPLTLPRLQRLRLVAVETGYKYKKWIRCRRWSIVHRLLNEFTEFGSRGRRENGAVEVRYENKLFENQEVVVDGQVFVGCTFRNVVLVYRGESNAITMNGCTFDGGHWKFAGAAAETLHFMKAMHDEMGPLGDSAIKEMLSYITGDGKARTPTIVPVGKAKGIGGP